jgi:very-short-patch-repair endonuclease
VNPALRRLLDTHDGLVPTAQARTTVGSHVVAYAVRAGQAVIPFPGVLLDAGRPLTGDLRFRAALCYAGPASALSHTSALAVWRLPAMDDVVHVMTGPHRRLAAPGLVAHRRIAFRPEAPDVVTRNGMRVTRLEQSLVDAWPLLHDDAQRAPLLIAIADRMTTPARVRAALSARNLSGRAGLLGLRGKFEVGCRSSLELWGYDHVFTGSEFAHLRWQVPVRLGSRTVYLDTFDEATRTNFELDGAAYHTSTRDRERDLRRDARLATLGIQTVRFSHERLRSAPDEVRREALAILRSRALEAGGDKRAS